MARIIASLYFIICISPLLAEELAIPVMIGQTGASMNFGKNEIDGYRLAVEEWNERGGVQGKKIKLKIEDTNTNQQQIVTAFQRLAADSPPAILGPTWLDSFQAIIPVSQKKNILLIAPSAAREAFSEEYREWPVTFYHNCTIEAKFLADSLIGKGYKNIALIYQQDPFAEMMRALFLKTTGELKTDIGVPSNQTSFQSILTKLKSSKPDVLVVFLWDEQALLSLLQQVHVQLSELPIATIHDGEGWLENPAFKKVLPKFIHSKFVIADNSFEERFKRRFGYNPILTATNSYDAINVLLHAYSKGLKDAKEIREFMLNQEHDTVTFGKFKFAADGSVPSKVELKQNF